MKKWITRSLFLPILGKLAWIDTSRIAELKRLERSSYEEIYEYQSQNFVKTFQSSVKQSSYYRNKIESTGVSIDDIKSLNDLPKLPILRKSDIRSIYQEIAPRVKGNKGILFEKSSGSTGRPIEFIHTHDMKFWKIAEIFNHYEYTGWEIGDPHAFLWGASRDSHSTSISGKLYGWFLRFNWFNSFNLNEQMAITYLKKLRNNPPLLLIGYASSLALLAKFAIIHDITFTIPYVQSSAEKLTEDKRDLIATAFHSQIFDRYGCREVGNIAHECNKHQGLHSSSINHLEIINKEENVVSSGEIGSIVITNLKNRYFPFIRYMNEDMATAIDPILDCSCGRTLPIQVHNIEGRITDNFYFYDQVIVHGSYLSTLMYNVQEVDRYQIEQTDKDSIRIRYILNSGYEDINRVYIEESLANWIGDPITVEYEEVDFMESESSGKFRVLKSNYAKEAWSLE